MEIEESPYFIKLAPGLSLLRQRSDLVLPSKEQQTLGRSAENTSFCHVFSKEEKQGISIANEMGLWKDKSCKVSNGGIILFQSLSVARSKHWQQQSQAWWAGRARKRRDSQQWRCSLPMEVKNLVPCSSYGPEPCPEILWRLQCVVKIIFFHHTSTILKFTEFNLLNFEHLFLFLLLFLNATYFQHFIVI